MKEFDTIISKIKYDILKKVSKYAYEDTLDEQWPHIPYEIIPGTKASFRCCVYRERASIFQRVRLAMGMAPNDSENSMMHKGDRDIIYVINAACDQCSINRFAVTQNCHACLAKKCQKACPVGAISFIDKKAHIDQDLCKECGRCAAACPYHAITDQMRPCKRACPVNAISIDEDRKAIIDYEKCIRCGHCIIECPFGAIGDRNYIVDVIKEIKSGKTVIAAVAPSIEGQFGANVSYGQIKNGIRALGFADVYEVGLGADMVSLHEATEFHDTIGERKVMTSSCCPAFVNLVRNHYPQLLDKVSGTVSPMGAVARFIKTKIPDAVVVFIGPCLAKKAEIADYDGGADYALTFEELDAMIDSKEIDLAGLESDELIQSTTSGKLFARSGGVTEAIRKASYELGYDAEIKPRRCNGAEECKKALMLMKAGRLDENFIEGMVCEGGCTGGPATLEKAVKVNKVIEKSGQDSKNRCIYHNLCEFEANDLDLDR